MSAFELSYILLWVVLCVLLVGVTALYSAVGALATGAQLASPAAIDLSGSGPPLGDHVEVPELHDLDGRLLRDAHERWIFVTPDCAGCERVKEVLRAATPAEFDGGVLVVCRGRRDAVARWADDFPDWASIVFDDDHGLFSTFNIQATPYYVLLDSAGICVAKGMTDKTLARGTNSSGGRSSKAAAGVLAG